MTLGRLQLAQGDLKEAERLLQEAYDLQVRTAVRSRR